MAGKLPLVTEQQLTVMDMMRRDQPTHRILAAFSGDDLLAIRIIRSLVDARLAEAVMRGGDGLVYRLTTLGYHTCRYYLNLPDDETDRQFYLTNQFDSPWDDQPEPTTGGHHGRNN